MPFASGCSPSRRCLRGAEHPLRHGQQGSSFLVLPWESAARAKAGREQLGQQLKIPAKGHGHGLALPWAPGTWPHAALPRVGAGSEGVPWAGGSRVTGAGLGGVRWPGSPQGSGDPPRRHWQPGGKVRLWLLHTRVLRAEPLWAGLGRPPPRTPPCRAHAAPRCPVFPRAPGKAAGAMPSAASGQGRRVPTWETEEPVASTAMSRSPGLAGPRPAKRRLSPVQGRRGLI